MSSEQRTTPCPACNKPAYFATGLVVDAFDKPARVAITGPARCLNQECAQYSKRVSR